MNESTVEQIVNMPTNYMPENHTEEMRAEHVKHSGGNS